MRIGIFGGAFDPIHLGHLRLGYFAHEALSLNITYFVPSFISPHKPRSQIDINHRLKMLELALTNESWAAISDCEIKRKGKSYTFYTANFFKQKYPNATLYLLIGNDSYLDLASWHRYKEIFSVSNIVVLPRKTKQMPDNTAIESFVKTRTTDNVNELQAIKYGKLFFLNASKLNISSSQIRNILANDNSPKYLVPEKVLSYINSKQLYSRTHE